MFSIDFCCFLIRFSIDFFLPYFPVVHSSSSSDSSSSSIINATIFRQQPAVCFVCAGSSSSSSVQRCRQCDNTPMTHSLQGGQVSITVDRSCRVHPPAYFLSFSRDVVFPWLFDVGGRRCPWRRGSLASRSKYCSKFYPAGNFAVSSGPHTCRGWRIRAPPATGADTCWHHWWCCGPSLVCISFAATRFCRPPVDRFVSRSSDWSLADHPNAIAINTDGQASGANGL